MILCYMVACVPENRRLGLILQIQFNVDT